MAPKFRTSGILAFVAAISLFPANIIATPILTDRKGPPQALRANWTTMDHFWQPAMDFDTDSCYNTPAIGPDGEVATSLSPKGTRWPRGCRDASDLDNNNVYSRQRRNSGWCAYVYDYYFEKDTAGDVFHHGHRHEWEHIVVWVTDGIATHGGYHVSEASRVSWDGSHPKVVYHRDGGATHCFRLAREDDERKIENHRGAWFYGPLVSYSGFPSSELRDRLMGWDFGKGHIAINDLSFADNLRLAAPPGIVFDFGRDEGSPGTPEQLLATLRKGAGWPGLSYSTADGGRSFGLAERPWSSWRRR